MLTVFVRVKVKPGLEEDYVCKISGVDNEYCFVERWESHSSLEKHMASQHYIDAKAVFEELVEESQTTIGEKI